MSFIWLYILQGFVAFESVNQPGSYIRHQNSRLYVHAEEDEELYKNDASWELVNHISGGIFVGL